MGFFDFLHGEPPKSEAQIYMERRNKEYARKVALYKKMEANSIAHRVQDPPVRRQTSNNRSMANTISNSLTKCFENIIETPSSPTQTSYRSPSSCNTCASTQTIYDSASQDIFIVSNASAKPTDRSVIASGVIQRGSFKVGDNVTVQTIGGARKTTIVGMWRRGEKIQYANVSSGQIGIVLSNIADTLVKQGDKILK
jgi:hypothetical protein